MSHASRAQYYSRRQRNWLCFECVPTVTSEDSAQLSTHSRIPSITTADWTPSESFGNRKKNRRWTTHRTREICVVSGHRERVSQDIVNNRGCLSGMSQDIVNGEQI
jgi:hypothetical protein